MSPLLGLLLANEFDFQRSVAWEVNIAVPPVGCRAISSATVRIDIVPLLRLQCSPVEFVAECETPLSVSHSGGLGAARRVRIDQV